MCFYYFDHYLTDKVYLHFVFHSSVVHFSAILKCNDAHVNMQKRKFSFSYDPIQKFKNNLCVWSTKRWLDVAAQRVLLRLFIVLTSWQIPPLVSNQIQGSKLNLVYWWVIRLVFCFFYFYFFQNCFRWMKTKWLFQTNLATIDQILLELFW